MNGFVLHTRLAAAVPTVTVDLDRKLELRNGEVTLTHELVAFVDSMLLDVRHATAPGDPTKGAFRGRLSPTLETHSVGQQKPETRCSHPAACRVTR